MTTDNSIPQVKPPHEDYSKRYWLFTWWPYEAQGGMNDFDGSFDTVQDAINHAKLDESSRDRAMIFDAGNRKEAAILHVDKGWIILE